MNQTQNGPLGDDLLVGSKALAEWLNLPVRKIFYMGETGQLPLFKLGALWAGRKSTLTEHIAAVEATAVTEAAQKREEAVKASILRKEELSRRAKEIHRRRKARRTTNFEKLENEKVA